MQAASWRFEAVVREDWRMSMLKGPRGLATHPVWRRVDGCFDPQLTHCTLAIRLQLDRIRDRYVHRYTPPIARALRRGKASVHVYCKLRTVRLSLYLVKIVIPQPALVRSYLPWFQGREFHSLYKVEVNYIDVCTKYLSIKNKIYKERR